MKEFKNFDIYENLNLNKIQSNQRNLIELSNKGIKI
jgi:hypothetical protein